MIDVGAWGGEQARGGGGEPSSSPPRQRQRGMNHMMEQYLAREPTNGGIRAPADLDSKWLMHHSLFILWR